MVLSGIISTRKGLLLACVIAILFAMTNATNTVFPKPFHQENGDQVYTIDSRDFEFESIGHPSQVVNNAINRYFAIIFRRVMSGKAPRSSALPIADNVVTKCTIDVKTDDLNLRLETDETYSIDSFTAPTIKIVAETAFGAVRALETLSQLIDRGTFVPAVKINDKPRFQYRGFMIDTSRHYYPVNVIYQHLDAMAYSKFNVLHWHITDDQSFPYQSEVFPEMSKQGAFSNAHVYTIQDIKRIIAYAFERGIRVIPEFDTPGHVQRGFEALDPPILTDCYNTDGVKFKTGPLNPTLPETYVFLDKLYDEIKEVFPDQYVHIGGDEVIKTCWKSNPQITAWMHEHPEIATYNDLEQYFVQRLLEILKKKGLSYIVWQEIFDNGAKILPDTVVEVWDEGWQATMAKVYKAGFHSVLSSPFYLNYIKYGQDWKGYYLTEPTNFENGPAAETSGLVSGIEVCMWSEFVDATNFIARSWPRATAVGERAWSPKETTDIVDAEERLHEFRCKMIARGINMEPIENGANIIALGGKTFCREEWNPRYSPIWM